VADAVLARLTDLQYGRGEDTHGWMRRVLDAPPAEETAEGDAE
jgi:branched-chain amino acid aminotransferase